MPTPKFVFKKTALSLLLIFCFTMNSGQIKRSFKRQSNSGRGYLPEHHFQEKSYGQGKYLQAKVYLKWVDEKKILTILNAFLDIHITL